MINKRKLSMHHKVTINESSSYFAVKYDGRHIARLVVADVHLTSEPVESIYSGVVSVRNLRIVIFLGILNNLEVWGAAIDNAYLEAITEGKIYCCWTRI